MLNALTIHPDTTVYAVGSGMRVCGSLKNRWLPDMAQRPAPHPFDCGVSR